MNPVFGIKWNFSSTSTILILNVVQYLLPEVSSSLKSESMILCGGFCRLSQLMYIAVPNLPLSWSPLSSSPFCPLSAFLPDLLRYTEDTCVLSPSVVSSSLQPFGLQPTRLLCPWHSPGKNTGEGRRFLLQEIFPTQGSNPRLLHYRQILYHPSHQGTQAN